MIDQVLHIVRECVFLAPGANDPELSVQGRRAFRLLDLLGALQAQLVVAHQHNGLVHGLVAADAARTHCLLFRDSNNRYKTDIIVRSFVIVCLAVVVMV